MSERTICPSCGHAHVCDPPLTCTREMFEAQDSERMIAGELYATAYARGKADALAALHGALAAQDEREAQAGERCGVSRAFHGCDWPDAVAEKILALHRDQAALIEQWRKEANDKSAMLGWHLAKHSCADELTALLPASLSQEPSDP